MVYQAQLIILFLRLNDVQDVQDLARLQEESKLKMSSCHVILSSCPFTTMSSCHLVNMILSFCHLVILS